MRKGRHQLQQRAPRPAHAASRARHIQQRGPGCRCHALIAARRAAHHTPPPCSAQHCHHDAHIRRQSERKFQARAHSHAMHAAAAATAAAALQGCEGTAADAAVGVPVSSCGGSSCGGGSCGGGSCGGAIAGSMADSRGAAAPAPPATRMSASSLSRVDGLRDCCGVTTGAASPLAADGPANASDGIASEALHQQGAVRGRPSAADTVDLDTAIGAHA